MRILGIETSCDETGIALYDSELGLMADALYSQVKLHADYGGVVPELASRDHVRRILPLIEQVLTQSNSDLSEIDAIAYTAGPGLIGALLVGASVAAGLSLALAKPLVPVHHLEGHLLAPMLEPEPPEFPFLALLVSGGHTQLIAVEAFGEYQLLGESIDDAVGEAFDKTAKLMGLDYPGGPRLAAMAESGRPGRYPLPRPMTDRPGLDFSFSGLKTAVALYIKQQELSPQDQCDLAVDFQQAVVDTLVIKCRRALKATRLPRLVVAGGVSANTALRQALKELANELRVQVYFPRLQYCTDNGAMIAYAGYCRFRAGFGGAPAIEARPRWPLDELRGTPEA